MFFFQKSQRRGEIIFDIFAIISYSTESSDGSGVWCGLSLASWLSFLCLQAASEPKIRNPWTVSPTCYSALWMYCYLINPYSFYTIIIIPPSLHFSNINNLPGMIGVVSTYMSNIRIPCS